MKNKITKTKSPKQEVIICAGCDKSITEEFKIFEYSTNLDICFHNKIVDHGNAPLSLTENPFCADLYLSKIGPEDEKSRCSGDLPFATYGKSGNMGGFVVTNIDELRKKHHPEKYK